MRLLPTKDKINEADASFVIHILPIFHGMIQDTFKNIVSVSNWISLRN